MGKFLENYIFPDCHKMTHLPFVKEIERISQTREHILRTQQSVGQHGRTGGQPGLQSMILFQKEIEFIIKKLLHIENFRFKKGSGHCHITVSNFRGRQLIKKNDLIWLLFLGVLI